MSLPTDPSNSGGTDIQLFLGASYLSDSGIRTALEIGKTVYQDLNGIQLGNDYSLNLGLQFTW